MSNEHGGPAAADENYRAIFEHAAVSLWEMDVSRLRARLLEMRRAGIRLRDHLERRPEFIQEALSLVEVIDVNPATLRLFGVDRKERLLGPIQAVLRDAATTAMKETVQAIDEGRTDIEVEVTAARANGQTLHLIAKIYVPPADSDYNRMLVSFIDITARKEAEGRERQSANLLREIVDSSPDPIFVKDRSLRMVLCNTALSRLVGKKPEETYGKTDIENGWSPDLVKGNPEKRIDGWEKDDVAVLKGQTVRVKGEPSDFEGGIRYFETVKFPLKDDRGAIIGLVGTARDITEPRQLLEELARERTLLNVLLDNLPDRIYFKDRDGRFTRTSRSHALERGLSDPAEEIGRTDADFSGAGHASNAMEDERRIIETGEPMISKEELVTHRDGSEAWFVSTKMPLRSPGGEIIGTFGISYDITARKQVEAALARERALFDLLMDNLPDYIYFKDRESRFIRTSRSHAVALGLRDPSEALGKTDFDFYGPDTARQAYEDEREIMRTGKPLVDIEERESYRDRPDTWVITTKMPYRDERGEIAGTFGISHDITVRRRLEERNRQLAALVESSDDAIVGVTMDRRITTWNRGAQNVYGYTAEEMIGSPTSKVIPADMEDEAILIRDKLLRGERIENFETTRQRKDGTRITVSLSMSAIRDETGRVIGMASVARDVTAQKAIQVQLQRMQRLESLATLAAGVSHQFNNINTIILGYLDLLRFDRELPARLKSYIAAATAAVKRAGDITDRLQAMAQPAGDPSTVVRLDELARSVLPSFRARIEAEEVRLVPDLSEAPPAAGESSRLALACSSLVSNALDSLLDRPLKVINVRTGRKGQWAFLEVEDSGCGIPKRDLSRLFSPFFSLKGEWAPPGSPQAGVRGLGLSLAISSAVVSDYGGRIEVDSTEGTGSVFRILLPVAEEPRKTPA